MGNFRNDNPKRQGKPSVFLLRSCRTVIGQKVMR
jgi:hypothetical protein